MISKLVENVDNRGLSVTSFLLGCHHVFSSVFVVIILKYNLVYYLLWRGIFMLLCSCPFLVIF